MLPVFSLLLVDSSCSNMLPALSVLDIVVNPAAIDTSDVEIPALLRSFSRFSLPEKSVFSCGKER